MACGIFCEAFLGLSLPLIIGYPGLLVLRTPDSLSSPVLALLSAFAEEKSIPLSALY